MVDEAPAALSQPQEASSALLSSFDAASALVPSQPQARAPMIKLTVLGLEDAVSSESAQLAA